MPGIYISSISYSTNSFSPQNQPEKQSTYITDRMNDEKERNAANMRHLLRELNRAPQENQTPNLMSSRDLVEGLFGKESKKVHSEKKAVYNYKEVEAKILRAKNTTGAGQAVLAAKRKVLEVKRMIARESGDPEELQLALTHAKRMEHVARKKKHHLELEEMIKATQKRDEEMEKYEEAADELTGAMTEIQEEEVVEKEDEIFEERQAMIEEAVSRADQNPEKYSGEMLAELNASIAEFGEEELKELEETMEMLEEQEILNPHMSPEKLEELKRKHRASEQKAMVKADMDYLKNLIKHQTGGKTPSSVMGQIGGAVTAPDAVGTNAMASMVSVDVQI